MKDEIEAEEAAAESDSDEDWDLLAELLAPAKKNDSERRDFRALPRQGKRCLSFGD